MSERGASNVEAGMEIVKQVLPILLTLSLAGLVMRVGLDATVDDLLYLMRRPQELLKAMAAVNVIPPAAAALLCLALPIAPVVKAGIMLMAVSPTPPLVPSQELKLGARKEYAYGIYVTMALLAIVVVPIAVSAAARLFGREIAIPFAAIAKTVLVGVLVPLALGMVVRRAAPRFAARLAPIVYTISMALVVAAFLPIVTVIWPDMMRLIGDGTLAAMAAIVAISLGAGRLLGGPGRLDRGALAIASSVRHPGIAMMLANANFADRRVTAAVLLFMLVSLVLSAIYKIWLKR